MFKNLLILEIGMMGWDIVGHLVWIKVSFYVVLFWDWNYSKLRDLTVFTLGYFMFRKNLEIEK